MQELVLCATVLLGPSGACSCSLVQASRRCTFHLPACAPLPSQPACSTSSDMLAAFDEGDCLQSADALDAATTGMYGSMDTSSSFDGFDTGHEAGKDKL